MSGKRARNSPSLSRRCTRPKTGATVTRISLEGAVCPRPTRDTAVSRSVERRLRKGGRPSKDPARKVVIQGLWAMQPYCNGRPK
jgi:hypothetical protein